MATVRVNGADLHYQERGQGPETIVFLHGFLLDSRMFEAQVSALAHRYRCVTYDMRGHGRSQVTEDGYGLDELAADAAGLMRALGCAPCHVVGASVGGCVALNLAIHEPSLLRSLVVLHASAEPERRRDFLEYTALAATVRLVGMRPLVDRIMPIFFGRAFREDPSRRPEREAWRAHLARMDRRAVYRGVRGIMRQWRWVDRIPEIRTPTLVVAGGDDPGTERLATRIPGARLERLPRTAMSSPIESPAEVTRLLGAFLDVVEAVRTPPPPMAPPARPELR